MKDEILIFWKNFTGITDCFVEISAVASKSRKLESAEARRLEEKIKNNAGTSTGEALLFSTSHTQAGEGITVLVIGCKIKKDYSKIKGVGVDLEFERREIKSEVASRFIGPDEKISGVGLDPVDFWVLKEAAFKSTPRPLQTVVTKYRLAEWDSKKNQGKMEFPGGQSFIKLVKISDLRLGLAYFCD